MENRKFRISIYVDQVDSHVKFRVFVNGGLAGRLVVRREEYIPFFGLLTAGEAHKPEHFKVEFHDKIFWEKEERNEW